jgi:hypothetical protein
MRGADSFTALISGTGLQNPKQSRDREGAVAAGSAVSSFNNRSLAVAALFRQDRLGRE